MHAKCPLRDVAGQKDYAEPSFPAAYKHSSLQLRMRARAQRNLMVLACTMYTNAIRRMQSLRAEQYRSPRGSIRFRVSAYMPSCLRTCSHACMPAYILVPAALARIARVHLRTHCSAACALGARRTAACSSEVVGNLPCVRADAACDVLAQLVEGSGHVDWCVCGDGAAAAGGRLARRLPDNRHSHQQPQELGAADALRALSGHKGWTGTKKRMDGYKAKDGRVQRKGWAGTKKRMDGNKEKDER
eukprot:6202475-Pleurochrysis_carterae.AAC.1